MMSLDRDLKGMKLIKTNDLWEFGICIRLGKFVDICAL